MTSAASRPSSVSTSFWTASSPANTSSQKNLSGAMRSRSSAVVMTWRTPTPSAIKAAIGAADVIVRSTPWDFASTWLWPLRTGTADVHRQRDHRRGSLEQRQAPFGAAWLLGALDSGHVILCNESVPMKAFYQVSRTLVVWFFE